LTWPHPCNVGQNRTFTFWSRWKLNFSHLSLTHRSLCWCFHRSLGPLSIFLL